MWFCVLLFVLIDGLQRFYQLCRRQWQYVLQVAYLAWWIGERGT